MANHRQTDVLYRTGHPVIQAAADQYVPSCGVLPRFLREAAEACRDAAFREAMLGVGAQWVEAGLPFEIRRFIPGEDVLTLSFEQGQQVPRLTVAADDQRAVSHLLADGQPILDDSCDWEGFLA